MLRNKLGDSIGPRGRIVIIVISALIALAILVFFLWRPVKPQLEKPAPFGAPADTAAKPAPSLPG